MKLRYSQTALHHLRAIHAHIARDNPRAAARVIDRIRQSTERLIQFPLSGRTGSVAGTHELPVPGLPYIVVYEVGSTTQPTIIIGVFHGPRER